MKMAIYVRFSTQIRNIEDKIIQFTESDRIKGLE